MFNTPADIFQRVLFNNTFEDTPTIVYLKTDLLWSNCGTQRLFHSQEKCTAKYLIFNLFRVLSSKIRLKLKHTNLLSRLKNWTLRVTYFNINENKLKSLLDLDFNNIYQPQNQTYLIFSMGFPNLTVTYSFKLVSYNLAAFLCSSLRHDKFIDFMSSVRW